MSDVTMRPYEGAADLRKMQELVRATWGPAVRPHVGGLAWSRFQHVGREAEWPTALWERDGDTLAWGWAMPPGELEMFVHPERPELADEVLDWFHGVATGDETGVTLLEGETRLASALAGHGYRREHADAPFVLRMSRDLRDSHDSRDSHDPSDLHDSHGPSGLRDPHDLHDPSGLRDPSGLHDPHDTHEPSGLRDPHDLHDLHDPSDPCHLRDLPEPELPPGFVARHVRGEEDVPARVAVHRSAFAPSSVTEESYRNVMGAWPYRRELDRVVEAPDGRLASYCLAWLDDANGVGELEPVGTHPDFRRMGLARAACLDALHRLREAGAVTAIVHPRGDTGYPVPARLYETLGFRTLDRTVRYTRHR